MEDEDDDFGDLYAYVEGEASSAMNASPQFSQIPCINDELDKQDADNDRECVDVDTDDEDDLDIVLNSGDGNVRPGEGFTIARNNTNLLSRQLEDEDDDRLRAEESMGGKAVDNSRSLYKYLRSQSTAYGSDIKGLGSMTADYFSREDSGYWLQMGSRSMGPQNAERFSLPRARSILDVNIDIFVLKPWRHPGADITDYFNFGFNEDSWKLYCNQVDEYRHKGPVFSGTPSSEPAQSTEVDTMKGQAIQVEESMYERQSSMDLRRQLDRDSHVIQITIVDQGDTETSNHGDVSGDDVTDHLSFSSASEDESIEGNYMKEDHEIHQVVTDETIRNSNNSIESNLVAESYETLDDDRCLTVLTRSAKPDYHHSEDSMKSDYHHSGESVKSDDERGPYENRYRSRRLGDNRKHGDRIYHERCNNLSYNNKTHKDFNLKSHQVVTHDPIRTSNTRKETNLPAKLFEAEESPANHFKSFDDDAYDRQRAYYTNDRWLTESNRSTKPGYHHPEADDKRRHDGNTYHTRKYRDCTYHERCNNHAYKDLNPKNHHENDDIISRGTVEKRNYAEPRYHARHDYFPMSDDVRSRLHVDPYEETMLYSKSEMSSGEKFYGYEDWDTERFGSDMDGSVSRISEDDEYYDEQRRYNEDNRMMVEDWYRYEKGLKKGEKLLLRNKVEFYFDRGCYGGENYKPSTYNDQKSYNVEYTRWEFGRNKRRVCCSSSELKNPPSSEESHVMIPKNSLHGRHGSCRGQSFEPFDREDHIMDVDGSVHMRRKRCRWQSEIQQEDDIMFRHEDAKFCGYRNSLPFGKVSRHKRLACDHFKELMDDPYVVGSQLVYNGSGYIKELTNGQFADGSRYYRQKNEVFSGKTYGKNRQQLPLSSRNSNLFVGEVKSTEKHKKPKKMNLNTRLKDKVASADGSKAIDEGLEMKEAEIVTEEVKVGRGHVKRPHNENGKSGIDNTRILEAMAKMEKRRARFNGPITSTRKNSDSPLKPTVVDAAQETASKKQERPARKRRWGGG